MGSRVAFLQEITVMVVSTAKANDWIFCFMVIPDTVLINGIIIVNVHSPVSCLTNGFDDPAFIDATG